jgi:hypothetical protein
MALVTACAATGPTEASEFARAEARWRAEGPPSYRYELRISCFCPPDHNEWHQVRVLDDAIVAVTNVEHQEAIAADRWDEWYTIDQIFARIAQFMASDIHDRVEATYHPTLGFPQEANLVAREEIADAGVLFRIRSFAAID